MRRCRFCKKDIEDAATACNHCGQSLIPGRAGTALSQPPATGAKAQSTNEASPPPTTKKCPFCAEEIQAAAIVCKHCNRDLPKAAPPPQPAGAPAQKKHGVKIAAAVLLSLLLLAILRVELSSPLPGGIVEAPSAHVVEYRVSGTSGIASLTYQNASGGTEQQRKVLLPWTYRVGEPHSGQFLYISAQAGDDGTIVAKILIDGAVVKHSESKGEYTIASASGRY